MKKFIITMCFIFSYSLMAFVGVNSIKSKSNNLTSAYRDLNTQCSHLTKSLGLSSFSVDVVSVSNKYKNSGNLRDFNNHQKYFVIKAICKTN